MKTKYIFWTIVMGLITIYSSIHDEKYPIAIPIIFGVITVFSLAIGLADRDIYNDDNDNTGCSQA